MSIVCVGCFKTVAHCSSLRRSIVEILHDREQLEFFRHYLFMHGTSAEMLLQFWMAVEDIKASIDNKRAFSAKLRRIQERFCMGKANRSKCLSLSS